MRLRQILLTLPISLLVLAGPLPASAGYNEGLAAYKKGETALAVKEFLPLARAGNANAQAMLGQILMNGGKGVAKDTKAGMDWVQRATEGGNVDAQVFLAQSLFYGNFGQAKNLEAAALWFGRAARAGDKRAMLPFAQMIANGVGMPEDPAGAVPYLEKLAADDDVNAQSLLGTLAVQGKGMAQDYAKAARHLGDATRQGEQNAAFVLGQLYLKGLGVKHDPARGLQLIIQSDNAGNYQAMLTLSVTLANGSDGVDQDIEQAYKWVTIVLNRAPQGDVFYNASGVETQIRPRLSNRQIAAAQAEASRFVVTPMKAAGK